VKSASPVVSADGVKPEGAAFGTPAVSTHQRVVVIGQTVAQELFA
jgi:hypothetical protein